MRYVCTLAWEQVKRRYQEGEGLGCVASQEEEKTQLAKRKEGEARRVRDPIATASNSRTFTRIVGIASTR